MDNWGEDWLSSVGHGVVDEADDSTRARRTGVSPPYWLPTLLPVLFVLGCGSNFGLLGSKSFTPKVSNVSKNYRGPYLVVGSPALF